MIYPVSIVAYFVVVLAMALLWNLALFRKQYETLTGAFLRDPPLFASGMAAIVIQAVAMAVAFQLVYPGGSLDVPRGLAIATVVNVGSVTYGALVVPGKFAIARPGSWIALELAYGAIVTALISIAMTLTWWQLG